MFKAAPNGAAPTLCPPRQPRALARGCGLRPVPARRAAADCTRRARCPTQRCPREVDCRDCSPHIRMCQLGAMLKPTSVAVSRTLRPKRLTVAEIDEIIAVATVDCDQVVTTATWRGGEVTATSELDDLSEIHPPAGPHIASSAGHLHRPLYSDSSPCQRFCPDRSRQHRHCTYSIAPHS